MAILGPLLIGLVARATKARPRVQLRVLPLIVAITMVVLALQDGFNGFVMAYLAYMLFVSMLNPPLMTLVNTETPDVMRSTLQSLFSFVMRIGGGLAAFGLAPVVQSYGISFTWGLAAAITAGAGLFWPWACARAPSPPTAPA